MRDGGIADLDEKIALLPAGGAGKVAYYATVLHASKLQVAALLDGDMSADHAAHQERLVNALGNKSVLRTKDAYDGPLERPAVEDLLRETLINLTREKLNWRVENNDPARSVVDILKTDNPDFSKYRLAKTFVHWTREHTAGNLSDTERASWKKLITSINGALN